MSDIIALSLFVFSERAILLVSEFIVFFFYKLVSFLGPVPLLELPDKAENNPPALVDHLSQVYAMNIDW